MITQNDLARFSERWGTGVTPERGESTRPASASFPQIIPFGDLQRVVRVTRPPELIKGLLYAGNKMIIGGPPKAKKTWLFHDLALSVAHGGHFLGKKCVQGRVLLIDLELQDFFLDERIRSVACKKELPDSVFENLDILRLRGRSCDVEGLTRQIIRGNQQYALIVIDPLYRVLAGMDENQAREVTGVCAKLEEMAVKSGAAIVAGMHFSKGNASNKSSMDRIAGSGVYARDADTIMTLTPHQDDDKFVAEWTLRNFPAIAPMVLGWDAPLYVPNPDIAPFLRQTARAANAFPREVVVARIEEILSEEGEMTKTALNKKVKDLGYARDPVRDLIDELIEEGVLEATGQRPIMIHLAEGGGEAAAA